MKGYGGDLELVFGRSVKIDRQDGLGGGVWERWNEAL